MLKATSYILFFLLLFASCKYEDGPLISLRNADGRLHGEYKMVKYTINGVDSLQQMQNRYGLYFYFYYCEDGGYDAIDIYKNSNINGYWEFGSTYSLEENNKTLNITQGITMLTGTCTIFPQNIYWTILKLASRDIHLRTTYNGKEYYLELEDY